MPACDGAIIGLDWIGSDWIAWYGGGDAVCIVLAPTPAHAWLHAAEGINVLTMEIEHINADALEAAAADAKVRQLAGCWLLAP